MSVPPHLQLLLDALGEKVKRVGDLELCEPISSPINEAKDPPGVQQPALSPLTAVNASSVPLRPNPDWLPAPQRAMTLQALVEELTGSLKTEVHPTVLRIYQTLACLALEVAKCRGYNPCVNQVTFHVPKEVLAFYLGMNRTNLWRQLGPLVKRGLIDHRPHKTTLTRRGTRNDGTLWAVRLNPTRGKRARLSYEDMKHCWRDLEGDIHKGRTAFNAVKQSKRPKDQQEAINNLLFWALPPKEQKTPSNMTVSRPPEAIFDLPYAAKGERGAMVDALATGICRHLGDDSLNFYRRLLWQLLRLHDRGQDYLAAVHNAIIRAGADKREGFARKAGALFVSRLKASGLWELLQNTPAYRVGVRPLDA